MNRASLFALPASLLLFIAACTKAYEPPLPELPGLWQETEAPGQTAGFTYRIKFAADGTFRLNRHVFTSVSNPDSCAASHTEYIKGDYALDGDRLRLNGLYFDSSFSIPTASCAGVGAFNVQHLIKGEGKNLLLDYDGTPAERITLVPVVVQ